MLRARLVETSTIPSVTSGYVCFVAKPKGIQRFVVSITKMTRVDQTLTKSVTLPQDPHARREVDPAGPDPGLRRD